MAFRLSQLHPWAFLGGIVLFIMVALAAAFMLPNSPNRRPPLDTVIDSILKETPPPRTYSELIDKITQQYDPVPPPDRGLGYGEEEFWRMPRQVRGNEPWTEKELKAGGVAQIHWLRGGSPDKVVRIYVIDVSGGGGCWGGGGPRGMYSFFVGANDELYGWYTDGISPLK